MKGSLWCAALVAIVLGAAAGSAAAQTQTISASASSRGGINPGNGIASGPSKITCTQASGSTSGVTSCYISSPGFNGLLAVGESIGTNGAGNVQLTCQGTYSNSGALNCSARIEPTVCTATQNISASANMNLVTRGSAALATNAVVRCTSLSGGSNMSCGIQSANGNVFLTVGQETLVTGPGTASLQCGGSFSSSGGLSCTARVTQVCP